MRPVPPDQVATVEVVMGDGAEANGAAAPPPVPQPATVAAPPLPPDRAAGAPAAPPPSAGKPADKPSWQSSAMLGDGLVGAAELVGERLRPAVGNRGNIPPGYPHVSAALGEQGLVVLRMTIGAAGLVTSVEVLQTSGYPRLDAAARAAIAKWRFTPAVENGQPVESTEDLPVHFRLN